VIAAYFLSIIISVLFAAGISPFYQSVFQGGILMVVLVFGNLWTLRTRNWLTILKN
jgi:ribose transport system permease protein